MGKDKIIDTVCDIRYVVRAFNSKDHHSLTMVQQCMTIEPFVKNEPYFFAALRLAKISCQQKLVI